MLLTKAYNELTGASLTHWDMQNLGFLEETKIELAIELLIG